MPSHARNAATTVAIKSVEPMDGLRNLDSPERWARCDNRADQAGMGGFHGKDAGTKVVATGRSDFPNQGNNALGFPAIFRGVLDVEATKITDEMCIAAAEELARCAEEKGLSEAYILPRLDDWQVFPREAAAVGLKAIALGVARRTMTKEALLEKAVMRITRARDTTRTLMQHGIIPKAG